MSGGKPDLLLASPPRVFSFFHRPTDLRDRLVDRDHACRRPRALGVAHCDVSPDRTADGQRHLPVSRRQCPGSRRDGGRADRAAGQRRREHDVHVFDVGQRRQLQPDGDLQARHRHEPGAGAGAEPRRAGHAAAARRHQGDGRDDQEAVAGYPAGHWHLVSQRQVRPALPEQLRDDPAPARAGAAAGHQRGADVRPARLQHADLARPGQAGDPQHDGRRRGQRLARAEPPGGRRPGRPVADGRRAEDPGHADDAGPAGRTRAIRQDHRQEDARRPGGPDPGHRPRRAGREEPGHEQQGQRHARGQHGGLPAPRRQCPGDGGHRQGQDRGDEQGLPRGRRLHDPLRHHAVHPRVDPGGVQDAAGLGDAGGPGRADLPPELAVVDHPAGGRAGRHRGHVRGDAGDGLQPE